MHRIGVTFVWTGIISTAVGLIVGFAQLPSGDGEKVGFWLAMIPVGFLLLMVGMTITQLGRK